MSYKQTIIDDGAVHYWRLGGGPVNWETDEIGNGDLTRVDPNTLMDTATGLIANDSDTCVDFNYSGSANTTAPHFWIGPALAAGGIACCEMTVRIDVAHIASFISCAIEGAQRNNQQLGSDGKLYMSVGPNNSGTVSTAAGVFTFGAKQHLVFNWENPDTVLYLNAVEVLRITGNIFNNIDKVILGGNFATNRSSTRGIFPETMDDVSLFPAALTSQQIAAHKKLVFGEGVAIRRALKLGANF